MGLEQVNGWIILLTSLAASVGAGLFWVWQKFAIGDMLKRRSDFVYQERNDRREYNQAIEKERIQAQLEIDKKQIEANLTQESYKSDMVMTLLAQQIEFNNEVVHKILDDIKTIVQTIEGTTKLTYADIDLMQRYYFELEKKNNEGGKNDE